MATDFKWVGFDPLLALMGGPTGAFNLLSKQLANLSKAATFLQKANSLQATLIDMAIASLELNNLVVDFEAASLKIVLDKVKQDINDLFGTGVYFLDLNKSTPPLWSFGKSFKEQSIQDEIVSTQTALELEKSKGAVADPSVLLRLENSIKLLEEKKGLVRFTRGGCIQYYKEYVASLEDKNDFNRPTFGPDAPIAAMFVMYGSSNLTVVLEATQRLKALIGNNDSSPILIDPLLNLKASYIHNSPIDGYFAHVSYHYQLGVDAFLSDGDTSAPDKGIQTHGDGESYPHFTITYMHSESGEIASTVGVRLSASLLSACNSSADTHTIYLHPQQSDTYKDTHHSIVIANKEAIELDELEVGNFEYREHQLTYSSKYTEYSSLAPVGILVYDQASNIPKDANIVLRWDVPKQHRLVERFLSGTTIRYHDVYVFRKTISDDDPFEDLSTVLASGTPPSPSSSLTVWVVNMIHDAAGFTFDSIRSSLDDDNLGVSRYEYAVASSYTLYLSGASYPLIMSDLTPDYLRSVGLTDHATVVEQRSLRAIEERKTYHARKKERNELNNAANMHNEVDAMLADLEARYGAKETIPMITVDLSNVAGIDIMNKYNYVPSNPPDWKSYRTFMELIPSLYKYLQDAVEYVRQLSASLTSPMDGLISDLEAIKEALSGLIKKLLSIINGLTTLLKALAALRTGAYVLPMSSSKGGVAFTANMLALSLQGELTSSKDEVLMGTPYYGLSTVTNNGKKITRLPITIGPPPFGEDDYVGGFVLLSSTADWMPDLLKPADLWATLLDSRSKLLRSLEATFDQFKDFVKNIDIEKELKKLGETIKHAADGGEEKATTAADDGEKKATTAADDPAADDASSEDDGEEKATTAAENLAAEEANQNNDTPGVAKGLGGAGDPPPAVKPFFEEAAKAGAKVTNPDGSPITNGAWKMFLDALKKGDSQYLLDAADALSISGFILPVASAYQRREDATALRNYKATLSLAIAQALLQIELDDSMFGATPTVADVDPLAGVRVGPEGDSLRLGWNVVSFYTWDARLLYSKVMNDTLESKCLNESWVIDPRYQVSYDATVMNDAWDITLFTH
jgi:hypothetical protein